jgi:hypothetical protein
MRRELTPEEVVDIRERRAAVGTTYSALAKPYGVSIDTVCKLCHGITYTDVDGPLEKPNVAVDEPGEKWLPIPGMEVYAVSTHGRIKSLRRNLLMSVHQMKGAREGSARYWSVSLSLGGNVQRVSVHRAMAEAFIGLAPPNSQVIHKNGDSLDNQLENLEWKSRESVNILNRRHGLTSLGEASDSSSLTDAQARDLRERIAAGDQGSNLAREFKVSQSTVSLIKRGRTYHTAGGPIQRRHHKGGHPPVSHTVCNHKWMCPDCHQESGHPAACLILHEYQQRCTYHEVNPPLF